MAKIKSNKRMKLNSGRLISCFNDSIDSAEKSKKQTCKKVENVPTISCVHENRFNDMKCLKTIHCEAIEQCHTD